MASIFSKTKQIMGVQNPNPYYDLNVKYKLKSRFKNYIQKIIASISSKVVVGIIFVSNSINIEFEGKINFNGKKKVIYHGLDPLLMNKDKPLKTMYNDYILCVSDFYPHKNFEVLVNAFKNLPKHFQKEIKLLIVGGFIDYDYFNKIKEIIDSNNLDNQIIITGKVDFDEVNLYYKSAKIFIMPSILETFGLPIIEAAQHGLPLLLAKSACLPEIGGSYAKYFDPNDYVELSKLILKLHEDEGTYNEMSKKAIKLSSKFSWEITRKETFDFFNECIN